MDPTLHDYDVPSFAERIKKYAPTHRLRLCMQPTPIQRFDLARAIPTLRDDVTIAIKREDLTHSAASGNKLRKLEFLLADALATGHDTIVTAGGVQSNHARATVVAARELQLDVHVFLRWGDRTRECNPEHLGCDGNVLMHKLYGARIHLVEKMPYLTGILPRMQALKQQLAEEEEKRNAYLIGIGGSDAIGTWGYVDAFNEMLQQGIVGRFSHMAVAIGSGGTAAGLAIANYLSKSPLRIVAFTVSDTAQYFFDVIDDLLESFGLGEETCAKDIITIVEAKGDGYGVNTPEDMKTIINIATATGIALDGTYTFKAVSGLVMEVNKGDEGAFQKNASILFVHTGGLLSMFDRRIEQHVDHSLASLWKHSQ